jgi:hypothetical protein
MLLLRCRRQAKAWAKAIDTFYTADYVYKSRGRPLLLASALVLQPAMAQVDIPTGTELSIRLDSVLSSKHSQAGESVSATLIAPVPIRGGEALRAGFVVRGTVANPTPAHKRLNHAVLWLNFGELIGEANRSVPFHAKVLSVDNGRESVDSEGVIHGLRPLRRRPGEIEDLLLLAAAAHPAVLASLELGRFVVAEEEKPRITYEKGVELWLSLTTPLRIRAAPEPQTGRRPVALSRSKDLEALVSGLPARTSTPHGTPSDLVNVLLLGSQEAVVNAFARAGWLAAESLDLKTKTETFFAVADHHSYKEGPVSSLLIDGQKPALVFEKETNTFAKRHHIRIWRQRETFRGMPVWIGAGTHDTGINFSRKARTFSHSVDSEIDQERQKIENDLIFTGDVAASGLVGRAGVPRSFQNATGDRLRTDGAIAVLSLRPAP